VDSANPVLTYADTQAYIASFKKLELLVVVDVAMTETARLAHYILPAASQFEKLEGSAFNLEFPQNFFHFRKPLFEPLEESLPEPEIYTRLLEKMGILPATFPLLNTLAQFEPKITARLGYLAALQLYFKQKPHLKRFASSIMYRTLGKTLPQNMASAAPMLGMATGYVARYEQAVKRTGIKGNKKTLGNALFETILAETSGVIISKHEFEEVWSLVKNPDQKIYLEIPEMIEALQKLQPQPNESTDFPFILMAGERRSYNANQIYRNPAWRKTDPKGNLKMHPETAQALAIVAGAAVICTSERGSLRVFVALDDTLRRNVVSLPNGYGLQYNDTPPDGPALNLLTQSNHCEPFTKTPYHKYVPVKITKVLA
jgi:anaerobic selenocysteine-containing dehydrogenase